MTEKLLNYPQISPAIKEMGGKGVTEQMGMNPFIYPGHFGIFGQYFLYSSCWQTFPVAVEEHGIVFLLPQKLRPALIEVSGQPLGGGTADEHDPFFRPLPPDTDFIGIKVNLLQIQADQLTDSEARSVE